MPFRIVFFLLVALGIGAPLGLAQAQEEKAVRTYTPQQLLQAAGKALSVNALKDAETILKVIRPESVDVQELDFLWGTLALKKGDTDEAIKRFRAILARDPTLLRVRLDLALAFFRNEDDSSAEYHFRQVLSDETKLTQATVNNIVILLDQIRRRKKWSVSVNGYLNLDDNVNSSTKAKTIPLFGLPATLSEDARQKSGIGLTLNVSGGYEWRMQPDRRFRVGGGVFTKTFKNNNYNDHTVTGFAGPRFLFPTHEIRPELTGRVRRLDDKVYSRAGGLKLSGVWLPDRNLRLDGSASAERIFYVNPATGDGSYKTVNLGASRALTSSTQLHGSVGYTREKVDARSRSWKEGWVSFNLTQEFPMGFVVTLSPTYQQRLYDIPILAYSRERREDKRYIGRLKLSNRGIELFGFMPTFSVVHERRKSNYPLNEYQRTYGEFGLVRIF